MIFVNTTFKGHYPVGTATVVCAMSQQEEPVKPEDMVKFVAKSGNILWDGNY